ncbi:MAG: protein kinase [Planctomycetaceae bacterium]
MSTNEEHLEELLDEWHERYCDGLGEALTPRELCPNGTDEIWAILEERINRILLGNFAVQERIPFTGVPNAGFRPDPGRDLVLQKLLGEGGFGQVWKAYDSSIDEYRAVKFCLNPVSAESLKNEARLLKRLKKCSQAAGFVRILGTRLNSTTLPYIEYEYIDGIDVGTQLSKSFQSSARFTARQAALLIVRIADIVAIAHEDGDEPIVHRDLKFANILTPNKSDLHDQSFKFSDKLINDLKIYVSDFGVGGISRTEPKSNPKSLSLGAIHDGSGTANYMSQEQRAGESAHPADDVYALGVMWYELIQGRIGHAAPTGSQWKSELREKHKISESQVSVLERCFESREFRFSNAHDLANAIRDQFDLPSPDAALQSDVNALQKALNKLYTFHGAMICEFIHVLQRLRDDELRLMIQDRVNQRHAEWHKQAIDGNPLAQLLLGVCHSHDLIPESNLDLGISWLRQASRSLPSATFELAVASNMEQKPDEDELLALIEKSASEGFAPAQISMGYIKSFGRHQMFMVRADIDIEEGRKWFDRAGCEKDSLGRNAEILERTAFLPKVFPHSTVYLESASVHGSMAASVELALRSASDQWLSSLPGFDFYVQPDDYLSWLKDDKLADEWMKKASSQIPDSPAGCCLLAALGHASQGNVSEFRTASSWLSRMAKTCNRKSLTEVIGYDGLRFDAPDQTKYYFTDAALKLIAELKPDSDHVREFVRNVIEDGRATISDELRSYAEASGLDSVI